MIQMSSTLTNRKIQHYARNSSTKSLEFIEKKIIRKVKEQLFLLEIIFMVIRNPEILSVFIRWNVEVFYNRCQVTKSFETKWA